MQQSRNVVVCGSAALPDTFIEFIFSGVTHAENTVCTLGLFGVRLMAYYEDYITAVTTAVFQYSGAGWIIAAVFVCLNVFLRVTLNKPASRSPFKEALVVW